MTVFTVTLTYSTKRVTVNFKDIKGIGPYLSSLDEIPLHISIDIITF